MGLAELIAGFRQEADDVAEPHLFEDSHVIRWLNDAQNEACERAKLLFDTSSALCEIPIVAGTRIYDIDERVIDCESAIIRGQRQAMRRVSRVDALKRSNIEVPTSYAVEFHGGASKLYLGSVPNANGFIDLSLWRRPMAAMQLTPSVVNPEIRSSAHRSLIYWALHMAFSTRDVDAQAAGKAAEYLKRFTDAFGRQIDWNVRRKQARHTPPVTNPALGDY